LSTFLLALIAAGVVVMATIQVAALVYAGRIAKRIEELSAQIERDVQPIFADLRGFSNDAARAMSVAASQVERLDGLLNDLTTRVEQTFTMVQTKVLAPIREGATLIAGLRALLSVLRQVSGARRPPEAAVDEEDALFIG
jgi:hypothetical protein